METIKLLFFTSLALLFYTYLGYGLLLFIYSKMKARKSLPVLEDKDLPEVTHIIAAFNEEDIIEDKIRNSLMLDYPYGKLKTIIVTDGSSDQTPAIVRNHPRVKLYHQDPRKGKLHAVDRVMKEVDSPVTIFSDANAMLNSKAARQLVNHFQKNNVGAVAGEKCVRSSSCDDATGSGEGLYWKYESFLKRLDYQVNTVCGAAGELFAIRTHLYQKPDQDTLIEDFVLTMNVVAQGYRVAYEPRATASETASSDASQELKRKIRISAGGLQSIHKLSRLMDPVKYGISSWQVISHRFMRWSVAPLCLVLCFISNLLLTKSAHWFFDLAMILQVVFYTMALAGFYMERVKTRAKVLFVPFYFTFMNLSVFLGLMKLIRGDFSVVWEKAERKMAVEDPFFQDLAA